MSTVTVRIQALGHYQSVSDLDGFTIDGGGLADGIDFFTNVERRKRIWLDAVDWVKLAIQTVRSASEPNPWKDAPDEVIAGQLLFRIKLKDEMGNRDE